MGKYRKKPVEVEAERLTERTEIKTLEGTMVGNPGDWLITGIAGEKYPCKDEIFQATYEGVTACETRDHDHADEKVALLIGQDLKKELEDAAVYANEPVSVFCERLLRSGLRDLRRAEMEY